MTTTRRNDGDDDGDLNDGDEPEQLALLPVLAPQDQRMLDVEAWDMEVPVALADDDVYVPVAALCTKLGIASSQMQVRRIRSNDVLAPHLRQYRLRVGRSRQVMYCLGMEAIGMWLGGISVNAVRPEIRMQLIRFQRDLFQAARELFRAYMTGDTPALGEIDLSDRGAVERRLRDLEDFGSFMHYRVAATEREIGELRKHLGLDDK